MHRTKPGTRRRETVDESVQLDAPTLPQAVQEGGQLVIHVDDLQAGDKIVVQIPNDQTNWHPTRGDTLRGYLNDIASENAVYIDQNDLTSPAWDTYFDPSDLLNGTYVATYTKTSEVHDVVGSLPTSVTLEGIAAPSYALELDCITPNGEPADGIAENQGRAVVTYGDAVLQDAQTVKFTFEGGSASFDTSKPYVKRPDSTRTVLYVQTHTLNNQAVADAYFTDAQPETVTLKAALPDFQDVPSQTKDFAFAVVSAQRYKVRITDYDSLIADGESTSVAGTVSDTLTGRAVDGTCRVQCAWPVGGPDSAAVTNGTFSFSVYGEYASGRVPRHGEVTVAYGDGSDKVGIYVAPLPP